MLAYRLVFNESLLIPRSFCPSCRTTIAWYDNIPIFSWLRLNGKCRICKTQISLLYPVIELLCLIVLTALVLLIPFKFVFAYFIFFSALLISIRTDLETMLIPQYASIFLVPLGFLFSAIGLLPLSLYQSCVGAITAGIFLYAIATLFYLITKKNGLGEGDIELLLFIGSFTGCIGWWATLLIGSLLGSIIGTTYLLISKANLRTQPIPFGPFLATGAIVYVLLEPFIVKLLFPFSLY